MSFWKLGKRWSRASQNSKKLHCISVNQSKLTTLPCFQSVLEAANLKLISDVKHSDIPASSSTNNKDLYGVALLKILWRHQRSLLHRRVPHHTTSTVRWRPSCQLAEPQPVSHCAYKTHPQQKKKKRTKNTFPFPPKPNNTKIQNSHLLCKGVRPQDHKTIKEQTQGGVLGNSFHFWHCCLMYFRGCVVCGYCTDAYASLHFQLHLHDRSLTDLTGHCLDQYTLKIK